MAKDHQVELNGRMIEGKFVARKTSDDPIIYRVSFDDGTGFLEVGSISRRQRHTGHQDVYWHWGVDTLPLAAGNPERRGLVERSGY